MLAALEVRPKIVLPIDRPSAAKSRRISYLLLSMAWTFRVFLYTENAVFLIITDVATFVYASEMWWTWAVSVVGSLLRHESYEYVHPDLRVYCNFLIAVLRLIDKLASFHLYILVNLEFHQKQFHPSYPSHGSFVTLSNINPPIIATVREMKTAISGRIGEIRCHFF